MIATRRPIGGRSDREGPVASGGPLTAAARRTTKALRIGAARPTSALRPFPDFLIVGAQRSGTTSLYRYLSRHPAVLPVLFGKGVHYFDTGFDRGPAWYRAHFPTASRRARVARREGVEPVSGEGSPYYLFHPLAPERVAATIPDVRIVVVLRDPVARAYSHYNHERARGFEDLSFEDAIAAEPERLAGEDTRIRHEPGYRSSSHQHHSYVARGMYLEQLERWRAVVGPDRILILLSEELFADPDAIYRRTLSFLGVPERSLASYERANSRAYPPMPERVEATLRERFAEPNRALAASLGRPLPWGAP